MNADVWVEFQYASILHTEAWRKCLGTGCRYMNCNGMDTLMMVNTIGRVNYEKMVEMSKRICEMIEATDEVIIKSPAGTSLRAYNRGRKARQSGKLADTPGEPVMLGEQAHHIRTESY